MKKKTIKLFGITMSMLLLLTGCGKVPKLENGQDAVVTLDGGDISVDELYNSMKERYGVTQLIELADTQILNSKYKNDQDIEDRVQDYYDIQVAYLGGEDNLLTQLKNEGFSDADDFKDYLRLYYMRKQATTDYTKSIVSDSEIEDFYDEVIFGDISAKHILITPDVATNATDAEKTEAEANALKEANEIISKLNNGEDFDELAKEYSDDEATASKGGQLVDISHGNLIEGMENLEEIIRDLGVGKYTTEPVKSSLGYHIIYKVSQKDKPELKSVKDSIVEEIAANKLAEDPSLEVTALVELREEYNFSIQDDNLKNRYDSYIDYLKEQASN